MSAMQARHAHGKMHESKMQVQMRMCLMCLRVSCKCLHALIVCTMRMCIMCLHVLAWARASVHALVFLLIQREMPEVS